MRPRLVALDLDGTIVHTHGSVAWEVVSSTLPSDRVRRAVRALDTAGVGVILASGRMYAGMRGVHDHLGLRSPLVCQQGCAVHEPGGGVTHEFPLALDLAHAVIAYARELGRPYEWFTPLRYLASAENDASKGYAMLSGVAAEYHAAPESSGLLPTGVGIISTPEAAPAIHAELVARLGDRVHLIDFPSVTVCVSTGATKGRALELLCADLGVERESVVAVGDSVNDAPMLEWAGRGYTVTHGDRYAHAAADHVLDTSEDDGVAALLERIAAGQPL
ncbi:MAG: HAD hydrolase family protein [Chloroflexi bacterium]|nr:HAD hydrolase family protein [Chloroflexota bacterium]MDA1003138.1 HAD hydrolase family protein [Chloroflexota bacterium]MQC27733.1 HAD family hydrolase [Chloroflexota bacterium]